MGDKQELWRANDQQQPAEMRPPRSSLPGSTAPRRLSERQNEAPGARTQQQQHGSENSPSASSGQFKLNPNASEWFPKNVPLGTSSQNKNVEVVTSKLQTRLNIHRTPSETNEHRNPVANEAQIREFIAEHNDTDMKRLKSLLHTLNKDPGQFDNLLDIIMETLYPYLNDIMAVSNLAKLLVNEAITNPNFRYTAAKLCWWIDESSPAFRAELPLKCHKQLEDESNLQNTILFVGELYVQLKHSDVYGPKLIDGLDKLTARGTADDIKCVCQALKLTGYELEKKNKNGLESIIQQLQSVKSKMNGTGLNMLKSVLQLRQANWGRTEDQNDAAAENDNQYYYEGGHNNIMYQTDGCNLTNEESDFIAAHLHSNEELTLSDVSDPDELCDPEPEMDEEIQAAFKEFVKLQSKK